MTKQQHLGVVGAGAWGTALACAARRAGSRVTLWAREADTVEVVNERHENPVFLPGVALDPALAATTDMAGLNACDVVLLVAPSAFLGRVCETLAPYLSERSAVCVCTKGIERDTGRLMTDLAADHLERDGICALSGPSFAAEVAAGLPTAVTVAGSEPQVARITGALAGPTFRIYQSDDVTGIEIGGAVKNVIAIACGIAMGCGLGHNARAAVISRGLNEMARLGAALGARRETLMGLSGLGDLVLTCTGKLSRNLTFGQGIGRGDTVGELLAGRASVVEGAVTAPAVVALAQRLGVEMPIASAVDDVLAGRLDVAEAIEALLARPMGQELT
ncbi:MAG: glycerol-3-phosphate acyltransferase [Rhodospirillaceae bacterium]|nr:glycerol-3-phosphate acyltransferase [Rhodospirillaceae bacterium]|tara:strand:- start:10598 stop:11596 length:999 start_codon:yes stop_codon:yes gene_type:complete